MKDKDKKLIYEAYINEAFNRAKIIPDGTVGIANVDLLLVDDYFEETVYMTPEAFKKRSGYDYEDTDDDELLQVSAGGQYKFKTEMELDYYDDMDEVVYIGEHVSGPNPGFGTIHIPHDELLKYFDLSSSGRARAALRGLR